MTKTERQQSLIRARAACERLTYHTEALPGDAVPLWVADLIAGFKLLDAKEQAQAKAGKKFGKLGAAYGAKGGRPKGSKNSQHGGARKRKGKE